VSPVTNPAQLPLRGGDIAVDFVNTVHDVRTEQGEYLNSPEDLARWAHHARVLTDDELEVVVASLFDNRASARRTFRSTLQLRAATSRLLTGQPTASDAEVIDQWRRRGAFRHHLVLVDHLPVLQWSGEVDLESIPVRITASLLDLIESGRWAQVSQCRGQRCGWLYLDPSPTRRRRWCSMDDCGNRAKVRRFRSRAD
jgi:predicted RNA-binding Zn ribbon-like protein